MGGLNNNLSSKEPAVNSIKQEGSSCVQASKNNESGADYIKEEASPDDQAPVTDDSAVKNIKQKASYDDKVPTTDKPTHTSEKQETTLKNQESISKQKRFCRDQTCDPKEQDRTSLKQEHKFKAKDSNNGGLLYLLRQSISNPPRIYFRKDDDKYDEILRSLRDKTESELDKPLPETTTKVLAARNLDSKDSAPPKSIKPPNLKRNLPTNMEHNMSKNQRKKLRRRLRIQEKLDMQAQETNPTGTGHTHENSGSEQARPSPSTNSGKTSFTMNSSDTETPELKGGSEDKDLSKKARKIFKDLPKGSSKNKAAELIGNYSDAMAIYKMRDTANKKSPSSNPNGQHSGDKQNGTLPSKRLPMPLVYEPEVENYSASSEDATSTSTTKTKPDCEPIKAKSSSKICEVRPKDLPLDEYDTSSLKLYDDDLLIPVHSMYDIRRLADIYNEEVGYLNQGFRNFGTTCFMNASLQCLFHCTDFTKYLLDTYTAATHDGDNFCPLIRIRNMAHRIYVDKKKVAPRELNPLLLREKQHDAEEFLTSLLEKLIDGIVLEFQRNYPSTCHQVQNISNPISQLFGTTTRTTLTCRCGHVSNSLSESLILNLPMRPTLVGSLDEIAKCELIEDYICSACKQAGGVMKQDAIRVPPKTLIMRIERSMFDAAGAYKDKTAVSFPERLNLSRHLVPGSPSRSHIYHLQGMVCHEGTSVTNGHYIANVLSSDGVWRCYDDDNIFELERPVLRSSQVYILFYTRDDNFELQSNIDYQIISDSSLIED